MITLASAYEVQPLLPVPPMPDYDANPHRNAAAAVVAAYDHWKSGQIDAAAELCREILKDVPDHFGAHHVLGLVADAKGENQLAVSHLERAAAAADAPAFIHEDLAKVYRRQ